VQPFIAEFRGSHKGRSDGAGRVKSIDNPLPTQTCENRFGLVEPFFFNMQRARDPILSVDRPMPTITATSSDYGLCEPFIVSYYGTQNVSRVDQPLPTCTAKSRFGLVQVSANTYLDIHFRMLSWRELAAAMGFPPDYDFAGTQEEKVKQIGNSVEIRTAKAHARAALAA
jgi:DNA (cytosine-5)-methyltransferase 1